MKEMEFTVHMRMDGGTKIKVPDTVAKRLMKVVDAEVKKMECEKRAKKVSYKEHPQEAKMTQWF